MITTIWHNPRCSKSRQTLELLQQQGIEPTVVKYLDVPPSAAELTQVLAMLGKSAIELTRVKEQLVKELSLNLTDLSETQLIETLTAHPKLIERPVVIHAGKAAIGRPPESVLGLFK
ncbi:arsenate reductase (glutaredoxin) [Ferrimonas lipolytica]